MRTERSDDYKDTYTSYTAAAQVGGKVYRVGPGRYRVTTPIARPYHRPREKAAVSRLLRRLGVQN